MLTKDYIDRGKPCCSNPNLHDAAIGWKLFKIKLCFNCNQAQFKNPFMEWVFENFLQIFWGGRLFIEK